MNKVGYIKAGTDTFTYQLGERAEFKDYDKTGQSNNRLSPIRVDSYNVYPFGANNLEPNEAKDLIGSNRLLPELIEKQIKILYGRGPVLYKDEIDEDNYPSRTYHKDEQVAEWLDSWKEIGLPDSFREYINKCIRSFYYCEGIFSKWRLSKGVRFGMGLPVAGLEHVSVLRCRLATTNSVANRFDFEDKEFNKIIIGYWDNFSTKEYKVYPRLDYTTPLSNNCAISYAKNPTHGEEIYSFNVFYRGVKDWIKGSNLTPKYINDYMENALSARLHIIIPASWLKSKENMLRDLCNTNAAIKESATSGTNIEYQKIKFSDSDIMEIGCEYHEGLLNEYTSRELKKLTNFLSGAGKNQGKLYASYSFTNQDGNEERWKIEEIPQKYKEYIEAHMSYDKRADEVMLSSKGIDSSISNISKEGVISKSGSDALYNYMIYLNGLTIPEEVICQDVNFALKLNFPDKYKQGLRIGFYRPTLAKQQDTSPVNRMSNQKDF